VPPAASESGRGATPRFPRRPAWTSIASTGFWSCWALGPLRSAWRRRCRPGGGSPGTSDQWSGSCRGAVRWGRRRSSSLAHPRRPGKGSSCRIVP